MDPHGQDRGGGHTTDYLHLCMGVVVPIKTVQCFPNKPGISPDVKHLLKRNERVLKGGDWAELNRLQGANQGPTETEESYRGEVQQKLQENHTRSGKVWKP